MSMKNINHFNRYTHKKKEKVDKKGNGPRKNCGSKYRAESWTSSFWYVTY